MKKKTEGEMLRETRLQANLTRKQVAEKMGGVSTSYIAWIETTWMKVSEREKELYLDAIRRAA